MKQNKRRLTKIIGCILFFLAVGFFSLQMGYLYVHSKFQAAYIDDRLFYMINIFCIICLFLAIVYLLKLTKRSKLIVMGIGVAFIIVNMVMLVSSNQEIKNITSISPDWKQVLVVKQNKETGEAVYYRSHYGILARPKEKLPYETTGEFKTEWLADDVVAVTYKATDNMIQQFIGTYGDRGSGMSYYYVGPEIHGKWQGDNIVVLSDPKGISITENNETELFEWDHIHQFGTLAIVLKRNNEAVWTISLNENFEIFSDAAKPNTGNISIYKATMEENKPIQLHYVDSH